MEEVLFSHESRFGLVSDGYRERVWRERGGQNRLATAVGVAPYRGGTQIENYAGQTSEMYFRQSTYYVPLTDKVKENLTVRFAEDVLHLINPVDVISEKYCPFFNEPKDIAKNAILAELEYWDLKFERTALELLKVCDKDIFPHLHTLLRIFITLPISNSSPERTFSTLRRLWLRSKTEEERLTGVALLHIHRNM
nr:unnamed protein product [Callosobruchus chinensis]